FDWVLNTLLPHSEDDFFLRFIRMTDTTELLFSAVKLNNLLLVQKLLNAKAELLDCTQEDYKVVLQAALALAYKNERWYIVAGLVSLRASNLPSEMNPAIFTDQPTREALENSIRGLDDFIKKNASISGMRSSLLKLLVDTRELIE